MEIRTIEIKAYRSPDGKPTCVSDFNLNEICDYISYGNYGTKFCCMFSTANLEREGELGYLRPHAYCPVWKGEV